MTDYQCDVAVIGGGLAGMVCALELLDSGLKVTIFDRDDADRFGGLAKQAFGGMALVDTPIQRLHGIQDRPEIALKDWHNFALFDDDDLWPKRWAEHYVERSRPDIYDWLRGKGLRFFPVPHWVERGENGEGNSLPRYHILWGTGAHLIKVLSAHLTDHPHNSQLKRYFGHQVRSLEMQDGNCTGFSGSDSSGNEFRCTAGAVVVAAGGINGSLARVRKEWDPQMGPAPRHLLNGAHRFADGTLHDAVDSAGGSLHKLHQMWNYAGGIRDPDGDTPESGLSLIPPRSALWLNAHGRRFGPTPLLSGFNTHSLIQRINNSEPGYSWQVMNWRIARKELALSGVAHNRAFRERSITAMIRQIAFGDEKLVRLVTSRYPDVVTAASTGELVAKMNAIGDGPLIDRELLESEIGNYDDQIRRGISLFNDPQLVRLAHLRQWKGDRARICPFQTILDPKAGPLIAIRLFIISRKSMGGIKTDLQSRVLDTRDEAINGLYAIGEAAGFGGGGISGKRSLEGTFLSNCILNARAAARSLRGISI